MISRFLAAVRARAPIRDEPPIRARWRAMLGLRPLKDAVIGVLVQGGSLMIAWLQVHFGWSFFHDSTVQTEYKRLQRDLRRSGWGLFARQAVHYGMLALQVRHRNEASAVRIYSNIMNRYVDHDDIGWSWA